MRDPTQMPPPLPSVIVDMPPVGNGLSWQEAGTRTWVLMLDRVPIARVTQDLQGKHHVAYVAHRDTWPTSGYDTLHNAQVEATHQALTGRKARLIATQREIALLQNLLKG